MNRRERFQRVQRVFLAARELPPAERAALLDAECADDPTMREELLGMLEAESERFGVLDRPALGPGFDLAALAPGAVRQRMEPPARIRRYEIVRLIGQGGMGAVYEARQDEPSRSVALKVMHGGTMSPRSLRRFRQESQVLGRLHHPGIAQIHEAGVEDWGDGPQPFFAMELVEGEPLLEHAKHRELGVRERIALLARVCDAVHHAHQKGVIHRDLKPANILVVDGELDTSGETGSSGGSRDARAAQPKILDFGVARLLDPDHIACTLDTGVGQIVGTVPYMSPEQAAGDSAAIDIRSDVYALGVIAFELLAGRHPLGLDAEGRDRPLHDALHVVREGRPLRLGAVDPSLRGDVETVVAKALEREPHRRYASAAELAADLRRILRHEPILARRSGAIEQFRKFARRNRALVAAAGLAVAALAAVTVVSLRLAAVADAARAEETRLRGLADDRAAEARREAYRGRLAAAAAALRGHDAADALQQLEAAPEELRGWEWRHLRSRVDESVAVATDCGAARMNMAFGRDGAEVFVATANGGLQRRRADDLSLIASSTIPGTFRDRRVTGLDTCADPPRLRIVTVAKALTIDPGSLEVVEQRTAPGEGRAIDSSGRSVVVESAATQQKRVARLVRFADGAVLAERGPIVEGSMAAAFSPDDELAAIALHAGDGLTVHATADGREVLARPHLQHVGVIRFSGDGRRLAAGTLDGTVHVMQIDGSAPDIALDQFTGPVARPGVAALDFSPDGSLVATASRDGAVRLWDLDSRRVVAIFHGHATTPDEIAFSPDGRHVATACSGDRSIRLWNAEVRGEAFVFPMPQSVYSITFSPDGQRLAAASLGGTNPVRIWDRASGAEVAAFGDGAASALAFDIAGDRLAIGRSGGDTSIVRASDWTEIQRIGGPWWRTDWIGFAPDGEHLLRVANSGRLTSVDLAASRVTRLLSQETPESAHNLGSRFAWSPDGLRAALTAAKEIRLLEGRTLSEIDRLRGHSGQVCAVAFAPDGARLASGGTDRLVHIWDVGRRAVIATVAGHTDAVFATAFSPDGRRLATAGDDRVVIIWDTASWTSVARLTGHSAFIYCLAWSPDGMCLASGSADDTVRLWDTRPVRELLAARGAVQANVEAAAASPRRNAP